MATPQNVLLDKAADTFAISCNTFAQRLEKEQASLFIRKIVFEVLSFTVYGTPVDTGHLRRNWQIGLGQPKTFELASEDKHGASTISEGMQSLATYTLGDAVWISNPVNYAPYVENGTERMAPRKMLYRGLQSATKVVNQGLKLL